MLPLLPSPWGSGVYELNDKREDTTSEESQVGGQGGEDICDEAKSVRAV